MPNLAIFDFDGTITHTDSYTKFLLTQVERARFKGHKAQLIACFLGYKLGVISARTVRCKVLELVYQGMPEAELKALGQSYSDYVLPSLLRENAMEQIAWHKIQGDEIVIVSASMDVYLKPWCDQHQLELSCSEVDYKNGFVTGHYVNGDCSREVKKQRILQQYDLSGYQDIFVYGDTPEDFAMLSLGTKKIYQWQEFK